MYVYNRMKQNDHFNYEFRQKEIRERNQQDIARQQELQKKSSKREYDDSYKGKSGGSFWDQKQGDNSKGSSDTQDTGYGGYKKEDQDRKRSQQQANQFDFDFNFQGSGSNNENDEPRRRGGGGKRYDEDDDDEDNNNCDRGGASSGNNPSTFDFDNYAGDRGKDDYDRDDRRRDRDYDRDKGDSGYGSKFDFDSYGGSRGDQERDRDDYKYGGGSSYSESYGSNKKYDKGITAIGSSGEMYGPNGYVPGTKLQEKKSIEKKIMKTAVAVGSVLKERVPEAINYIKEEIAPSSGPSLPNTAQYNDPYGNNASRIERQRQNQIDGKNNDDEEEYNEDSAWGDVKQAKKEVIDSSAHTRDYDDRRSPRGYGSSYNNSRRDNYGEDRDKRYNYDNYDNDYDRDRDRNRYSYGNDRSRDRDNKYGNKNDFGYGNNDDRDNDEDKKKDSTNFFDFDMGGPSKSTTKDDERRSRSRSRSRSRDKGRNSNSYGSGSG